MNGSLEPTGRFSGNGDGFHRHSLSSSNHNHNHMSLGFADMMSSAALGSSHQGSSSTVEPSRFASPSAANIGTSGSSSGSRGSVSVNSHAGASTGSGPITANAYESHDDLCVDGCMGVGLYNGYQQFNHRGGNPSLQSRWARGNTISQYGYSTVSTTNLCALPAQYRHETSFTPSASDSFPSWLSQHLTTSVQCNDEDCQSMNSCCDSQCTMTGKCTDLACANTEDACTDQNCPSRPSFEHSSEVVNGAAALISINHAPGNHQQNFSMQQQVMSDVSFGLSNQPQESFMLPTALLPPSLGNITNHILVAHADPTNPNCTRPCPLDDPQNYTYCHFPLYNAPGMFDQYNSVGSNVQMGQAFVECGAEIHDPQSFLEHFNTQHRPQFTSAGLVIPTFSSQSAQPRQGGHGGQTGQSVQNGQSEQSGLASNALPSTESMSSPITPLDTSDSCRSSNTPSPVTPLSNSVEMSDGKPECSPHIRGTSVASFASNSVDIGVEEEHRCLWRNDGSSQVCGQLFADAEELFKHTSEVHIKNAQKGAQGFRCGWDDCPRSEPGAAGFPQRSKIERHMQTHIGHKPHICPTCNKGFSAKQALTQHMFIHSNEKPLTCNICQKAFRYPSALTMHQRVHSGLKPLKCPVCGKGFSESSNLSKHKRTHEVKGRFTCTIPGCDRNFHRQDQLRRHMKTHQRGGGENRPPPPVVVPEPQGLSVVQG